jgi:hypothetical protein
MPAVRAGREPFLFARTFFPIGVIAFVLVSACSRAPSPQQDTKLEGHWEGAVQFEDHIMPVVFDVAVEKDRRLVAEADLHSEGIEDYPVEMRAQGDSVWIAMQSPEKDAPSMPMLAGRLDPATQRIAGEFVHDGERYPFQIERTGIAQISSARKAFESAPAQQVMAISPDAHELRETFNRDAGKTRLLLFLSPT